MICMMARAWTPIVRRKAAGADLVSTDLVSSDTYFRRVVPSEALMGTKLQWGTIVLLRDDQMHGDDHQAIFPPRILLSTTTEAIISFLLLIHFLSRLFPNGELLTMTITRRE